MSENAEEKAPEPAPPQEPAPSAPAPAPQPEVIGVVTPEATPATAEPSKPAPEPAAEAEGEPEPAAREPSALESFDLPLTLLVLVAGVVLLALIQLSTPELVDHDSLYHVGAAHALAHHGDNILTKRLFPWMQGTFLRDHYADKELLFHSILMPICADARTMDENAKYATIALGAAVLASFAFVLRGIGVRHAWLWLLLLLAQGENFTERLLMTRPHLVSMAVVILSVKFILQRRMLPLYFLGFVLSWSYSGPQVLPVLALVALVARWTRAGDIAWKPLAASAAGVAGGLVLNPFLPNNLYLWYVQNVEVLRRAWGFTPTNGHLGAELFGFDTRTLLTQTPGFCFTLALSVGALLLARRRPSVRTVTLGGLALAGVAALFLSGKFLDYAAPLVVLFAASAVDDQWRGGEGSLARTASGSAFVLLVIAGAVFATGRTAVFVKKYFSKPPALRGVAGWLAGNAQGATVVHFNWNDFSTLFHDNPKSYYLFGLDPTFMEVTCPEVLEYFEAIRHSTKPLSGRWFAEYQQFSPRAKYLVVRKNTPEANACYTSDLVMLYEDQGDEGGAVFALTRE